MLETFLLTEMSRDYSISIRKYQKTGWKDEWGLRCKDPLDVNEHHFEVFPLLNVGRDDFKAVTKVKGWIQI